MRASLIVLLLICAFGCATTKITIARLAPPRYPIKGGKKLAVVNFKSPPTAPSAGAKVASSFVSKLAPTHYYRLMERSRMDSILAEHRLAQTEYVDPAQAKELGRILNVDYIITGEVNAFSVEDEDTFEQETRTRIAGYYYDNRGRRMARFETYYVDVPVKVRRATVSAAFRMINVDTSHIIVGESKTANFRKRGYGSGGIASLPSCDFLLNKLADEVTRYFATLIAPHPVRDIRSLEKGKTPECKRGVKLAQSGLWDEATSAWERALAIRPDDAAPYNNLGVAAEEHGDYERACEYYQKALRMMPNKRSYMDNLENARHLKEDYARTPKR